MALTSQQISGLNALNQKIASGYQATDTDKANLAYATKQGYTYNPLPQGATKISDPNYLKTAGLTESQIYRSGADIYKLPEVPKTLPSSSLTEASPVIPKVENNNLDVASYLGAMDTKQKGAEEATRIQLAELESQKKKTEVMKQREDIADKLYTDQRAFTDQEMSKVDVNSLQAARGENRVMWQKRLGEIQALQEENKNRPISSRIIGGTEDRLVRQKAVEAGMYAAIDSAYSDNITEATDTLEKAIRIKFQPETDYIANLETQLGYIEGNLNREEKQRADALKIVLEERKRQIEEQQTKEQDIGDIMLKAAENGAPVSITQAIMNAKDKKEAIMKAGTWLGLSIEDQQKLAEAGYALDVNGNVIQDLGRDPITGAATDQSKVINGYNFTSYATDPEWGNKINNILNEQMPPLDDIQTLADYIAKKTGNTKQAFVTASAIWNAAIENGIDVEVLAAISQLESGFATSNVATKNNNPGGYTWNPSFGEDMKGSPRPAKEGGYYVKFPTLTDGFSAVARNIARRKQEVSETAPKTDQIAIDIFNGVGDLNKVSVKDYPAVQAKLAQLKEEAKAGGDLEGLMRASAGGKDVDATTATSFEKAFNVIGQLGELNTSVANEATGPIIGIIRSNNPYDTKAKLIQAQLTALIPNLARGIYGEVGVLTDNDVKLYAQTLPNLKSTEEVQKLILASTVRSVQRSIENKIKVQSGLGRDLSGLVDTYTEIKNLADSLESGSTQTTSNAESEWLQSVGLTPSVQSQEPKSSVWNWFRGLFGVEPQPSQTETIERLTREVVEK